MDHKDILVSSKNCGGPQYSLTKGLADGFTARVLIPQWQPYAAVELEFSEGWEFQIERVWGATRLSELGVSAYSQRKTFVLDATAPVVHGPEGYGCFGDEPEADDRQRSCGVFTFLARWGKFSGVAHAGHSAATPHPPGRVTCTPSAGRVAPTVESASLLHPCPLGLEYHGGEDKSQPAERLGGQAVDMCIVDGILSPCNEESHRCRRRRRRPHATQPSGGWVASGGGVVASGVEVYVFFRSDSEDSFDPLK